MIKKQLEAVSGKIAKQARRILGRSKGYTKKEIIETYIDAVCLAYPNIKREDIAIIVTGFLGELRSLTPDIRAEIIKGSQ